jgi:hypothetical protein
MMCGCARWPPLLATRPHRHKFPAAAQAVEAKEKVKATAEMRVSSSISYQALFGYYKKLCGMTVRTAANGLPSWPSCGLPAAALPPLLVLALPCLYRSLPP